jgi:hypothetical protein
MLNVPGGGNAWLWLFFPQHATVESLVLMPHAVVTPAATCEKSVVPQLSVAAQHWVL